MTTGTPPVDVVLAGARGHGAWHLANLRRLTDAGRARLAGICDVMPLEPDELTGLGTPEQGTALGELIERTGATTAVVCTPIHTHVDLALTAAAHGADVLLEKPTAAAYADYERLVSGVDSLGRACQIGFQSLGSQALCAVREAIADGAIGTVRGIGAAGAWVRERHYFARAAWAGRRTLNGVPVVDGALTNPLAHAVATALRLDGSDRAEDVDSIELELYRAHTIDSDDTSCVRIRTRRGTPITVAATLCAARGQDPYIIAHGDRGRITLWYTRDRLLQERHGHEPVQQSYPRTDLLENLIDHRAGRTELLVPARSTGAFMKVVEAVRTAPAPTALPEGSWLTAPGERSERRIVTGVDDLVAASAEKLALFTELGAPWAAARR